MVIRLADITLDPPVFLAPLAGITDLPFRNLVSGFGAGLVVSEMVASQEMVQARPSARARAELGFDAANTAVQIAGREAKWMAEAARLCAGNGAKIIDINMGCPARKVTNGYSGSALMRDPDHALHLIEAVVSAVDIPVTLKTRLGWDDDNLNAADIARRAEAAGVQMLTIHGRTRCQFYQGQANWQRIGAVVDAVSIPVVANGDITDATSAAKARLQSGAAGVMVGRGARGRPWLLAEIAGQGADCRPEGDALADMITRHYQAMIAFYGVDPGLKVARKHLGWYMDDLAPTPEARRAILTSRNPDDVCRMMRDLCRAEQPGKAA